MDTVTAALLCGCDGTALANVGFMDSQDFFFFSRYRLVLISLIPFFFYFDAEKIDDITSLLQ